jgi:hypothetical protein
LAHLDGLLSHLQLLEDLLVLQLSAVGLVELLRVELQLLEDILVVSVELRILGLDCLDLCLQLLFKLAAYSVFAAILLVKGF